MRPKLKFTLSPHRKREVWRHSDSDRRRVVYFDAGSEWALTFEENSDGWGEPDVTSLERLVQYGWLREELIKTRY